MGKSHNCGQSSTSMQEIQVIIPTCLSLKAGVSGGCWQVVSNCHLSRGELLPAPGWTLRVGTARGPPGVERRTVWTRLVTQEKPGGNMEISEKQVVVIRDIMEGEEVIVNGYRGLSYEEELANEHLPLDLSKPLFLDKDSLSGMGDHLRDSPLSISLDSSDSGVSGCEEEIIDIDNVDTGFNYNAFQRGQDKKKKKMLPCSFCPKYFDRPSLLSRHIRTHTGERPHSCTFCYKSFSTSSSLNTHVRIHSGEKPHQCNVCNKRFTASSNLYYHKMTHIKQKPHACSQCEKTFSTPGDLRNHQFTHNGRWPFPCKFCNKGFSKITNLRNHLTLHKT